LESKGKINAPGGTQKNWSKTHKRFIRSLFKEGYRLRYSGGMVPDLHQILLKGGGLFSYPDTTDKPDGKLRALFEVFPFALIFENAQGEAVDNLGNRVLDYEIESYHDTLPCFFGSKYEIERLKEAYGV
jgi:fructose-1,6-bisphosphatase I